MRLSFTLGDALRSAARHAPGDAALVGDDGTLTWAALAENVDRVAATLRALVAADGGAFEGTPRGAGEGAIEGRRTGGAAPRPHAVALRPDRDDVIVLLAHAVAGIPLLPLHPALPEADAARLAATAGARRLTPDQCLADAAAAAGSAKASAWPPSTRGPGPDDDLFLVPTSGSSGQPKVARLTHRAVLGAAAALTERLPFGPQDRWILTLPLSHVGGLSVVARCLCARHAIVLVPRFSEDAVWTAMARDGGTRLSAVPAIADRLLHADRHGQLARLSLMMLGGQAAPLALRRALAEAGVPAVASYGLTESCAAATCESPAEAGRLLPGCGTALRGVAVSIAGDDGAVLPAGTPGRIRLAGPALLAGYAGQPGVTVLDSAGRLATGDLGWLDDAGRLHVQGRRAEVIVTGGEKVVPGVVEAALREHAGVRDAVVFGRSDARWGAIVCAAVEGPAALHDDATLPALLATLLPPWARPRQLAVFEALPRLNTGKVDRLGTPELALPSLRPFPVPSFPLSRPGGIGLG
ncbi:MAG: AMP-binding protein [Rubrivivax sp.]|jgi:O-succinylbenzoic acid--CoA ligase|nr:AMP-binding protein [Betaproteobacteria bacterium]MBP6318666.1 AMP-binding protein [Rubrivivax sp.]MBK7279176.1 AMP-binding protein [Betaproteobacteria bacterium]MBK7458754.1 AMP-binding protein [Betaproteobacteria bacterium]MBK7517361.1 AMP-binding protein [Betaproteobacteria bacterium]